LSLYKELQRRNVFKVAAAYVIVAWLIMQLGDVMAPALHLPNWIQSALAFFLILGFPVAIVLSWAFELTHDGIRPEKTVEGEKIDAFLTGRNLIISVIVLLSLAVGILAFDKFVLDPERDAERIDVAGQTSRENSSVAKESRTESSIAVLAFEDMSPDKDQEYLSDGLAEELLNALAQIPELKVISRSSAFSYKGKGVKLGQIAADLDVSHILEGSVRKSGNRVRITAQLIDARSDSHLWSQTYDRTLDDIFAVQEDVARRVVSSLRATLSPRADERISRQPTEDLAAYDLYLQGREALHQDDAESNQIATRLFEEAIELDPDYALAWAGRADAAAQRDGRFGFPQGSTAGTAIKYARQALSIDPDLAEAHKALGYAYLRQGDIDDALEAYLTAVDLNPNYYDVWVGLSWIYETTGRYDDGVLAGVRAHRLAPNELSPLFYLAHNYKYLSLDDKVVEVTEKMLRLDPLNVGGRLFEPQLAVYHGDFDKAVRLAEQIVHDTPGSAFAMVGAASMVYMAGDFERALDWASEALRLEPGNRLGYWHHNEVLIGLSLLKSGQREEADNMLLPVIESYVRRIEEGQRDWGLEWDLASIHAARGDEQEAMDWFERAYEAGFRFARWPPVEPSFAAFRNNPRYRNVMAKMEAEIEHMRARVLEADTSVR
jgi:TolB-like protein/Flp pilus assembly protein TadD